MVYCNLKNNMVRLELLRLNITYDYNYSMGNINVVYKLRNQCHFEYWLPNLNCLWPILLWGIKIILVSEYVCYMAPSSSSQLLVMPYQQYPLPPLRPTTTVSLIGPNTAYVFLVTLTPPTGHTTRSLLWSFPSPNYAY